jgi:hypothetical protein
LTVGRFLVQQLQEEEEEEYCRPDRDGRSRRGGDEETDADDQQLLLCKTGIVITGLTTISIATPAIKSLALPSRFICFLEYSCMFVCHSLEREIFLLSPQYASRSYRA